VIKYGIYDDLEAPRYGSDSGFDMSKVKVTRSESFPVCLSVDENSVTSFTDGAV